MGSWLQILPATKICRVSASAIVEEDGTENYERPLAVVESIEREGGIALRLVAWSNEDFDSCEECMEFLRKE